MSEQETPVEPAPDKWSFLDAVEVLRQKYPLQPPAFDSDVPTVGPLIAGFREKWNNVSTKWYVLPIVQQLNSFNGSLLDLLQVNFQAIEEWVTNVNERLAAMEAQLQDIDARLVATDHDQTELGRSLAELDYQVIQTRRALSGLVGTDGELADQPGESEPPR